MHTRRHALSHVPVRSSTSALVLRRGVLEEVTGGVRGVGMGIGGGFTLGPNNRDTWLGGDTQREGECLCMYVCMCVCFMVNRHVGCVMCWTGCVTAALSFCPSSVLRKTKPQNL